jgi:transcriptional regulator GlxA family with amidase domain
MLQLPYMKNFDRLMNFFKLMNIIGRSHINIPLASADYIAKRLNTGSRRISMIHEFLMNNYLNNVDLEQIAEIVSMAKGSLCHFFRMNMGITIFEYLNKIKVDFACKLLMDPELSIAKVALDSGFNNISHFNKQFRKNTGFTPSEYRKHFKDLV